MTQENLKEKGKANPWSHGVHLPTIGTKATQDGASRQQTGKDQIGERLQPDGTPKDGPTDSRP